MTKTILITGASSGIGNECAIEASKLGLNIIATARGKQQLQELQKRYRNINIIVTDIATDEGRNIIANAITQPIDYILHNAAVLDNPQTFKEITLSDFRNNMATNVEPILFLTQKLLGNLTGIDNKARILSVSSGASKYAIAGLANYCISKAAALMANNIIKIELLKHHILVNNYFPGVVDTSMQKKLRSSSTNIFPYSDEFKNLKSEGKLANSTEVAKHIMHIFTKTKDDVFNKDNWTFE